MPKSWYSIKAAAPGSDVAEVSILEPIGGWGLTAKDFLAEFRALQAPNVKLFINSPGGSVFEALAMFNGMRATGKNIEVHILGVAASAASYIAMAGDKIVMPANSFMFVHNPINAVYGNADEMREMADILDKLAVSLTATYNKRFKGETKALQDLLAAESYLSAADCLEYGLCDEVTDEITAVASFDTDALPENIRALFTPKAAVTPPAAPKPPAAPPVALADEIALLAKDAGLEAYTPLFVTDPSLTSVEAAALAIGTARDIVAYSKHASLPEMADGLIRGRKTVAEARAALQTAQADLDAATRINTAKPAASNLPVGPADAWNPQSQWADLEANKARSYK